MLYKWTKEREEVPKSLKSLAREARKYKSAEEFVRAQEIVYRGGKTEGKYLSTSKDIAKDFARERGGNVSEFVINPKAKIATYSDFPNAKYKGINDYNVDKFAQGEDLLSFQNGKLEADYVKAERWAKEAGFDIIKLPTEAEVRVINQDILKTKQQLKDFYNQATKEVKKEKI